LGLVVACLSACGGRATVAPPDGGDARSGCAGARFCDGTTLRACHDGMPGAEIEKCADSAGACSLDRCTSAACAAAERDLTTFVGCRFYTAEVANVASDAARATSFLVTNGAGEPTEVTLERQLAGSWNFAGSETIAAGQSAARLTIAGLMITEAGRRDGGLRITTNQPVTVVQIESDDRERAALNSGGTLVLPVQALGTRHMVMTYPQAQTPALQSTLDSRGGAGRLLIVGTKAGTEVKVTVSRNASLVVDGTLATVEPGATFPVPLDDGEVFQAWSGDDKQDLSGTEIRATAPVAVFSGNIATTYGRTAGGINSPDMAHEQMPPIAHWSYEYVAAALPPQLGTCDTLLGTTNASVWRLLAALDDTRVEFRSLDPDKPVPETQMMHAGQVIEFVAETDFVVKGNLPLLLTQGIDCEASLSLAISVDKLLEDLTFSVLPYFDQMIAVVRRGTQPVLLDGVPIDNMFAPPGGEYQVARVPLEKCPVSKPLCTYRLQGLFGMTLRGMDVEASYALTAPAWTACIDPVTCVN
jgi:hypothetical protein